MNKVKFKDVGPELVEHLVNPKDAEVARRLGVHRDTVVNHIKQIEAQKEG